MRNFFIAVNIKQEGLYYPYMIRVSSSDNLVAKLDIKGLISANICQTKREAEELVRIWRESHKVNNELMFSLW